jgi:integrase
MIRSTTHAQQPQVPNTITVERLFAKYLQLHAKPRTKRWQDTEKNYQRYVSCFSKVQTRNLTRLQVQSWVDKLGRTKGKPTANRAYDILRAFLSWGIRKEVINHRNPCIGVDRFRLKARERFIQPGDEFDRLAAALDAEPDETARDFFWMSLFTGARKTNVLMMKWDDINFELGMWRIPDTKNGDTQYICLIDEALKILHRRHENKRCCWVFESTRRPGAHYSCPQSAWERIRTRAGIKDVRIHDLRRTLGSYLAIQGTSSTIIGKALGHRSLQATSIYARLSQNPVREAVTSALTPMLKKANVTNA